MTHRFLRVVPPILLALAGLAFAMWIIRFLLEIVVGFDPVAASSSLIPSIPGNIGADITWLIVYITPITFVVYILLGLPVACIMLIVTRIIKVTAFDIDIVMIGRDFGSWRMIKRAVLPALFSLSLSGVISGLVVNLLFTAISPFDALDLFYPLIAIAIGLVVLPIVLAFFIPTWILDDAGIVMHLKDRQLKDRRCPESIGVGRWWSNLQGGFTVITIPVVSFIQHFYSPIVVHHMPITTKLVLQGLLFTFTIPFLAMAFIMPVILLNEIMLRWTRKAVRRFAKSMGARELELQMKAVAAPIKDEQRDQADTDEIQKHAGETVPDKHDNPK